MKWFKHMSNMRNDLFVKELVSTYGLEGKAVWDMVLEIYADACGSNPGEPITMPFKVFLGEFNGLLGHRNSVTTYLTSQFLTSYW